MEKPKAKKVNYEIIAKTNTAYDVLDEALCWHGELYEANIALVWRKELKPDVDGRIVLGRCIKVSDLNKEFKEYDFIIVLNLEWWNHFTPEQRLALMDHELCHASAKVDEEGEQIEDERGRKVWRTRKHDIEEFREVVERHGCYKTDLESFARSLQLKAKTPLFESEPVAHTSKSPAHS